MRGVYTHKGFRNYIHEDTIQKQKIQIPLTIIRKFMRVIIVKMGIDRWVFKRVISLETTIGENEKLI